MKKILACLLLAGGIGAIALPEAFVSAQPAKKGTTAAKQATIILGETAKGKWYFTIRDADDKYLAGCTPVHASEKDAKASVENLKKALENFKYELKKGDDKEEEKKEEMKKKVDKK